MDIQIITAVIGLSMWLFVFIYGAVDSCLNPELGRPEPRPRPRYPKGR